MKKILNSNAGVVGVNTTTGLVTGMSDYNIVNTSDTELFEMVWGDPVINPFGRLFDTASNDIESTVLRMDASTFIRKTELTGTTAPTGAWTKVQSDPELLDGWADNIATVLPNAPEIVDKLFGYSKWVNRLDDSGGSIDVINGNDIISLPYTVSTAFTDTVITAKKLILSDVDLGDWSVAVGAVSGVSVTAETLVLRHEVVNNVERLMVFDVLIPAELVNSPFKVSVRFGPVATLDYVFDNEVALAALPNALLSLRLATYIKGVDYTDTGITPTTGIIATSGYGSPSVVSSTNEDQLLTFTMSRPCRVSLRTSTWGIDDVDSVGNDIVISVPGDKSVSDTYLLYVTTDDDVVWPPISIEYTAV